MFCLLFFFEPGKSILTHKIIDSVIANPIPVVFSIVIITCVTVLFIRITSDTTDIASNVGSTTSVSKPYVDINTIQHEVHQPNYELDVTNAGINNSNRFQSTTNNTNHSRYSSNKPDRNNINSTGYNNTSHAEDGFIDNLVRSSEGDVSIQSTINQTGISFSTGLVDTRSSPISIDSTIDNTASSPSESDTNQHQPTDPSDTPETPDVNEESDIACTVTSEHTVQIDLDETQTISCCPIVENGPSCMCTLTTTDASGTDVEVMNNCRS
jgi:hypothetical protein